jgi:hypothetical protein
MPDGGASFADLGLQLRAELLARLSQQARSWLEEPPIDRPGRPSRLPARTPAAAQRQEGDGPREWRIYGRRSHDSQAPFLLRAVLPDARPYDRLVDGAFRVFLNRAPDPSSRAAYGRALDSGTLAAELLLREIAASSEARSREEQMRVVNAPSP